MMNKSDVIPFRTTSQERQRLERMAAECEMSLSELVRFIVMGRRVELVTHTRSPAEANNNGGKEVSTNGI